LTLSPYSVVHIDGLIIVVITTIYFDSPLQSLDSLFPGVVAIDCHVRE
jgi:hypothetical protein